MDMSEHDQWLRRDAKRLHGSYLLWCQTMMFTAVEITADWTIQIYFHHVSSQRLFWLMIVHNLSVNKYERNKEIKYHNLKMMMMIELIITLIMWIWSLSGDLGASGEFTGFTAAGCECVSLLEDIVRSPFRVLPLWCHHGAGWYHTGAKLPPGIQKCVRD